MTVEKCESVGCPQPKGHSVLSGMGAMGHPVPFYRRQVAYEYLLEIGFDSGDAMSLTNAVSDKLERDKPYEAMDISVHGRRIDLTGMYRLFAHLLADPAPPKEEP